MTKLSFVYGDMKNRRSQDQTTIFC